MRFLTKAQERALARQWARQIAKRRALSSEAPPANPNAANAASAATNKPDELP